MSTSLTTIVVSIAITTAPTVRPPAPSRAVLDGIGPAAAAVAGTLLATDTGGGRPTVEGKGPEHYWGWTKVHIILTSVSVVMIAAGLGQPIRRLERKDGDILRTRGSDWVWSGVHLALAGWFGWRLYANYDTYRELSAGHGDHGDHGSHGSHGDHRRSSAAGDAGIAGRADASHADLDREEHRHGHDHGTKPAPVPAGMLVVEGGVFDAATGSPIPDAFVTVSTDPDRRIAVDPETGMFRTDPIPATRTVVTVTADAPNHIVEERDFAADRVGSKLQMAFKLRPRGAAGKGGVAGTVRNARTGKPIRAVIRVPEADVELTALDDGRWGVRLEPGRYEVVITLKGFRTRKRVVTVKAGESIVVDVDLTPRR